MVVKIVESQEVVSLQDLDRLMERRQQDPALAARLQEPLDLEAFIGLAEEFGCTVTEADVFAAQQREQGSLSSQDLQKCQAAEARRLRNFIHG